MMGYWTITVTSIPPIVLYFLVRLDKTIQNQVKAKLMLQLPVLAIKT